MFCFVFRMESSKRKKTQRKNTRMAVRMKRRMKPTLRKMMKRRMRWRTWLKATGTSCNIFLKPPLVRITSLWSSQVSAAGFLFWNTLSFQNSHTHRCFLFWFWFSLPSCFSSPAYIAAVYHSMKEELRRNTLRATPIKRRGGSQASQQAVGDLSALPGKIMFGKII